MIVTEKLQIVTEKLQFIDPTFRHFCLVPSLRASTPDEEFPPLMKTLDKSVETLGL